MDKIIIFLASLRSIAPDMTPGGKIRFFENWKELGISYPILIPIQDDDLGGGYPTPSSLSMMVECLGAEIQFSLFFLKK